MNLSSISALKPVITRAAGKTSLLAAKHAPDILTGAGVLGFIGTAVLASKETLTVDEVLEEDYEKLAKINRTKDDPKYADVYSASDVARDKTIVYSRMSGKLLKHYAPSIILGVASAACIISAHGIMKKRLAGAIAAYEAVDKAYKAYRNRVREIVGEEVYEKIDSSVETDQDGPDGKKIWEIDPVKGYKDISPYARAFDFQNQHWSPNKAATEMYLEAQQNYFNDMLQARGHVFLNEVYDALGLERTPEGQLVGWVRNNGDNYIDFKALEGSERVVRNIRGYGRIAVTEYVLDFNVDGVVYNLI